MARPRLLRLVTYGLVALSVLFPPWRGEATWGEADQFHQELKCGYGFLLSGPLFGCEHWAWDLVHNGRVDLERLALEWIGIAALSGIARLVLPEWW